MKMPVNYNKLWIACWNNDIKVIEFLIKNGADLNYKNKYGTTALMASAFLGHHDAVKLLINSGADTNIKDKNGDTAIMIAHNKKRIAIAELLRK